MNASVLKKALGVLLLILVTLGAPVPNRKVDADNNLTCEYVNNEYVCYENGSTGGGGSPPTSFPTNPGSCTPDGNQYQGKVYHPIYGYNGPALINGKPQCDVDDVWLDSCGNVVVDIGPEYGAGVDCPGSPNPTPAPQSNNCSLVYNDGTFTCTWSFKWQLVAEVSMPPIEIDVRPYPATLVNWPTTFRVDALAENSGNGSMDYAGLGGGTPSNPLPGDWRNITLILTFRPTGTPLTIGLSQQTSFTVPITGGTKVFEWLVPSHPAAGAVETAGAVGQLEEIPSDMTLFQGNSMTTYKLYYSFTYQEYSEHNVCQDPATPTPVSPPAIPPGSYHCINEVSVGTWNSNSENGEILPSQVTNLPASINGGDVYNDWTVVIRRMDENGNVNNPTYAHQYSWGSIFYFAVREGQGQVGWPSP